MCTDFFFSFGEGETENLKAGKKVLAWIMVLVICSCSSTVKELQGEDVACHAYISSFRLLYLNYNVKTYNW